MKGKTVTTSSLALILLSGLLSSSIAQAPFGPETTSSGILASAVISTSKPVSSELPSIASDKPGADQSSTSDGSNLYGEISRPEPWFSDQELAELRKLFLQAEDALRRRDDAEYFMLADRLTDYPLYPYLQYTWLKHNLGRDRQIEHFLDEHASSRYAPILRNRWLNNLGKNKQWDSFIEAYHDTDDTKLQCYYQRASYQKGSTESALKAASELWTAGYSQPRECDPLFDKLKQSSLFTQELKWTRFDAALRNFKTSLATYIMREMAAEYHDTAQLWLDLHRNPERHIDKLLNKKVKTDDLAVYSAMFSHAIYRLSSKDVTRAAELWDQNKDRYILGEDTTNRVEKRLAMRMALQRESGAFERFEQVSRHDSSSRTWRVRSALQEQDWNKVLIALDELDDSEKQMDRWQYWYARAYIETGQADKAQPILHDLAAQRSFYGYLAADRIDSMYRLAEDPVEVDEQELATLKAMPQFRVAHEFMVLDRVNDAKLQWWHAVKSLDKKQILAASKLAQQWQWPEIAIFTIAKAKHWDDIDIRFPVSYVENIQKNSEKHDLNPAILFGLIRRESAFNEKAYSPAGARGLMQIMPATARGIARQFNERWRGNNSMYKPELNIRYGSYYYQKLLKQFDGNYAIALAAYNAGPNRVKKWLPEDHNMPADIWIETIPVHETREYVVNVLAYALIYQLRDGVESKGADMLTMNELAKEITPAE